MDRRLTPANGRVAATHLRGQVTAEHFTDGTRRQVTGYPYLLASPGGSRDRQLLWGDAVTVYESVGGWAFVQADKDGYVGYTDSPLADPQPVTHRVAVRTTWAYPAPDFKQPASHALHCNSRLRVTAQAGRWAHVALPGEDGPAWVPARHILPLDPPASDPVGIAELFLGTPYVWGGNTGFGLDCSGLVQIALHACGLPCPGDSDQQEDALGLTLPEGTPPQRGDLMFWKGHVAWVADADALIHANAFDMAVAFEPLTAARSRILAQGDGPVTRHARLT